MMGEKTAIEWCHHTFNGWIGCQEVSPACDFCYAKTQNAHRGWVDGWGPKGERKRTSADNWRKPLRWARAARDLDYRPRVFCHSLADWLDNQVPWPWRHDLRHVVDATPELDWLLLTKRIENFKKLSPWTVLPPNVWLGITAEDQPYFDRRWGIAQEIYAKVHFVSYEPALGPLSITGERNLPDWIICGGESGSQAREMPEAWARCLLNECDAYGVKFFMKQMTRKRPIPADLLVRQFPQGMRRERSTLF